MNSLFDEHRKQQLSRQGPLAARMRPRSLDEFVGQQNVVGSDSLLRKMIERDRLSSLILWGPPGVGKTTLARLLADQTRAAFIAISAVSSGVSELRRVVSEAADRLGMQEQRTLLFIDEIHRFNKAQQDAILPYVEDGTVILVGATTENPSFEVIAPLLSRSRVIVLKSLDDNSIRTVIQRAIEDPVRGLGSENISISDDAMALLTNLSNGDARFALNTLEMASVAAEIGDEISVQMIAGATHRRAGIYDKSGDSHYDAISALHKSMRDSDADATLYWLARMIHGGDDPLYIARRLVRFASEDVGLADPQALPITVAAQQAVHFIGLPEGKLALAQAAVYLALAPKSNALYTGYAAAEADVEVTRNEPVPLHLRNAVTGLMKDIGYGAEYQYAHDDPEAVTSMVNLPNNLQHREYYSPTKRGFERELADRTIKRRHLKLQRQEQQESS